MKDLIIFGTKDLAQLARFYFELDGSRKVAAFTVDREFRSEENLAGLPVVDFEDVESKFPTKDFEMFLPMTQTQMGKRREKKFLEAKQKGYRLASYVSPKCTHYNFPIGENCFIFEDNTIQPFTEIGDNVIIWSGNHIGHHSRIASHVFITSHVVISGHVTVGKYSFFGVNSTVRDGINVAEGTLVGMGAVISKDTLPYRVYSIPGSKPQDEKKSTEVM